MWRELINLNDSGHGMYIFAIPRGNRIKNKERMPAWFANTYYRTFQLPTVWKQQRSSVCDVAPWQYPWDPHPPIPTPGLCIGGLPNNWALCPASLHWHPAQEPGGWLSFFSFIFGMDSFICWFFWKAKEDMVCVFFLLLLLFLSLFPCLFIRWMRF